MIERNAISARLHDCVLRRDLVEHRFFKLVQTAGIDRTRVRHVISQWWYPLHYFPTFLARSVAVLPDVGSKTAVSRILFQELGCGDPNGAHEAIFVESMTQAGFSPADVTLAPAFPETEALVAGYEMASTERFDALGSILATTVADLAMVSGIGTAVERVSGLKEIDWVEIHVRQGPDHAKEADNTMLASFGEREELLVLSGAAEMWRLWIAFFDRLERACFSEESIGSSEIPRT